MTGAPRFTIATLLPATSFVTSATRRASSRQTRAATDSKGDAFGHSNPYSCEKLADSYGPHADREALAAAEAGFPQLPLMLGIGMPAHAEMSSPILPAAATGIELVSELPGVPVLTSAEARDCRIQAAGKTVTDEELRKSPGDWAPTVSPSTVAPKR